jgi:hypothetical protein
MLCLKEVAAIQVVVPECLNEEWNDRLDIIVSPNGALLAAHLIAKVGLC